MVRAMLNALPQPVEQRQFDALDCPRPQEFEIIDQEREAEGGDALLVETILRQTRGQRRADHRVGKARGDPEEEGGE